MEEVSSILDLKERIHILKKEKQIILEAAEMVAGLTNYQTSLSKVDDPLFILRTNAERVRTLIRFKSISFYLVNEEDSSFYQALCDPENFSRDMEIEVSSLIEDKTFPWALRRNKPVFVSSGNGANQIVLHSMGTPSRIRGMFIGILGQDKDDIPDITRILLSVTINAGANALESFELYRQLHIVNRELKKSEEKYRSIFENAIEGIFQITPEGSFIDVNPSMVCSYGYGSKEDLMEQIRDIGTQLFVDTGKFTELKNLLSTKGSAYDFKAQMHHKDGATIWVSINARSVRNKSGRLLYYEGTMEDITERKRLEAQLDQAQKMEAIGQLAGGVAHDINNILTAIIGYAGLMDMKIEEGHEFGRYIKQILKSADNGTNLTQSLLAFSRKQIIDPKPARINDVVRTAEKLLSRLIGEDIDLAVVLSDKQMNVIADADQLSRVLMNLGTNARDAMPDGGTLTISTGYTVLEDDFVLSHGYGTTGSFALISVKDTGTGMDEQTRKRIFEPFFTTKEVGKGTGLGLSMVYGIVKQHKGFIDCKSEPGKGTEFRVYLPLLEEKVVEEETVTKPSPEGGAEVILIAEDNAEVRSLTKEILQKFGYTVIEAVDGNEAIEVFHRHKDVIRLVILDVVMPGKNGKQVYDEIRKADPDIKTIFTSGYTADIINRKGILDKGINFIFKPVSPEQLLRKVREVLDISRAALE